MWFLAISYGLAAPITAYFEATQGLISARFDYPPGLVYLVCASQVVAVGGLFVRSLAPWAAAGLSVITLGALVSHLKIGSPLTAVPAVLYTVIQVWFGWKRRAAGEVRS